MKKIAIFVEGMTEQEFVVWLVTSIAGSKGLHVVLGRQHGGKVVIATTTVDPDTAFYVLVVDCASDEQVKTQIKEQYPTLVATGYTAIIGLRDVFPKNVADIPKILARLSAGVPNAPVVPIIHLAVMEVEAWFIGELTHFPRIEQALSVERVEAGGFAVSTTHAEHWPNPATTLHDIYRLEKLAYRKTKKHVQRTIQSLSFAEISTTVRRAVPTLHNFLNSLEQELA